MLILASKSPRRQEILRDAGIEFTVRTAAVEEARGAAEPPEAYVQRLAREKALSVEAGNEDVVLGADTIVLVDGVVLEKPLDAADAGRMLRLLAGKEHSVLTGICLRGAGETLLDVVETRVRFAPMGEEEIARYVACGEPMDKAGAYGIQGQASKFVVGIDGCYFNVVGLPVSRVYQLLRKLGREA